MSGQDLFRYGLRYAVFFVGCLATVFAANLIGMTNSVSEPLDLNRGVFVYAAFMTYLCFLKDRERVPTRPEYLSLVLLCIPIVISIDMSLNAFHHIVGIERDMRLLPPLVGAPLIVGVLINCVCFSSPLGRKAVEGMKVRKAKMEAKRSA